MIVVRNVFQLKFGKAKDARTIIGEGLSALTAPGLIENRAYADLTGPFYTIIFDNVWDSLAAFEKTHAELGSHTKWQAFFAKFMPLVESGHREIYTVIV